MKSLWVVLFKYTIPRLAKDPHTFGLNVFPWETQRILVSCYAKLLQIAAPSKRNSSAKSLYNCYSVYQHSTSIDPSSAFTLPRIHQKADPRIIARQILRWWKLRII
jgi:hypothetical protein